LSTLPVSGSIGGVFVPVSDIQMAKDWYMRVFGLPESPVLFGHLWCTRLANGLWLNLDAKLRTPSGEVPIFRAPTLSFDTADIQAAFAYMQAQGVELVTEILNGHFFNIKDPDGNIHMICAPPQ
jgi:catechol 2,3-dioxygenase-like lactoylglutathione lyase family enzyme